MGIALTTEGASAAAGMPVLVVGPDLAAIDTQPGPLATEQLAYLVDVAQQCTRTLNSLAAGATNEVVDELLLEMRCRIDDYLRITDPDVPLPSFYELEKRVKHALWFGRDAHGGVTDKDTWHQGYSTAKRYVLAEFAKRQPCGGTRSCDAMVKTTGDLCSKCQRLARDAEADAERECG